MKPYVCWGTWKGATPPPFRRAERHPCGVAHEALLEAGYDPQVVRCYGWEALPGVFNLTPGRREVKQFEVSELRHDMNAGEFGIAGVRAGCPVGLDHIL